MTALSLSFGAATGLGLGLCFWLWPGFRLRGGDLLLAVSVAVPLGLGLGSTGFFLWVVVLQLPHLPLLAIEIVLAACLVAWRILGVRGNAAALGSQEQPPSTMGSLLSLGFLLGLALATYGFLCRSIIESHGLWDAWAIWNLKARFLFRGGEHWRDLLSVLISWSHPDYPLLIPGIIARGWTFAGGEAVSVPIAAHFLLTFATTGILVGAVWALRGRTQGFLAGLVLLGTPFFVAHGASQEADIPIAGFMLASLALLHWADHASQATGRFYFLAGLLAAMAAWTKNEGLLFFASILVAQIGCVVWRGTWGRDWRGVAAFCAGAFPIALLVIAFKVFLAPPTDLVAGQGIDTILARLGQPSRYLQVGKAFAKEFLNRSTWNLLPVVLPFYGLLVGVHPGVSATASCDAGCSRMRQTLIMTWATLALMMAGLFVVYLLTPRDLPWHLRTSVGRVFLQLWPSLLLAIFLLLRSPEEVGSAVPRGDEVPKATLG